MYIWTNNLIFLNFITLIFLNKQLQYDYDLIFKGFLSNILVGTSLKNHINCYAECRGIQYGCHIVFKLQFGLQRLWK